MAWIVSELYTHHVNRMPLFRFSLMGSLLVLTRLDLVLFILPVFAYVWYSRRSLNSLKIILAGFALLWLWELFSVLYYGFPFPNTAYAKLNTGIPKEDLLVQGGYYLWITVREDPLIFVILFFAAFLAFYRKDTKSKLMITGIGVYLAYVIYIGGDFMIGRFLSVPYFVAICVVARCMTLHRWTAVPLLLVLVSCV